MSEHEFFDADDLSDYDRERESLNDSEPPLSPDESMFLGVRMTCDLCGHVFTPWPGHEQCSFCGQRPKMAEGGSK